MQDGCHSDQSQRISCLLLKRKGVIPSSAREWIMWKYEFTEIGGYRFQKWAPVLVFGDCPPPPRWTGLGYSPPHEPHPCPCRRPARIERRVRLPHRGLPGTLLRICPREGRGIPNRRSLDGVAGAAGGAHSGGGRAAGQPRAADDLGGLCIVAGRAARPGRASIRSKRSLGPPGSRRRRATSRCS